MQADSERISMRQSLHAQARLSVGQPEVMAAHPRVTPFLSKSSLSLTIALSPATVCLQFQTVLFPN